MIEEDSKEIDEHEVESDNDSTRQQKQERQHD